MQAMARERGIFFLSADFGSPVLDELVRRHADRFVNVGIAEQNLINVAAGLALEGFTVFAYAIAPFLSMRCYEQIRVNLALLSQLRPLNVNLIGVGAGYSYDVSGPSHQALEDLCILRVLPNLEVFSPADWVSAAAFVPHALNTPRPKYIRLDGKALPALYPAPTALRVERGFEELLRGRDLCLVATGCMTHSALAVARQIQPRGLAIGVVDLFLLKQPDETALLETLRRYPRLLTLEEGFVGKGGLDMLILELLRRHRCVLPVETVGIPDRYGFEVGSRERHHRLNGMSEADLLERIGAYVQRS